MRRGILLSVIVAAGALSMSVAAQQPQGGQGQNQPRVVQVEKVKENLFVLRGGGGNTTLFVTTNGAVLVDTKLPGWGQPLLDQVKTLTNKPITTIINTHTHGDHVSGQTEFAGVTAEVVSHANTKTNMQKMDAYKDPKNAKMVPARTYTDKQSLFSGNDRIDLYYFGNGHTNGDTWVVFPALRIASSGDIFPGKTLPLADYANGGSATDLPGTLTKAADALKASVDTFVGGHTPTQLTPADLQQVISISRGFVSYVEGQMKGGKTPEQAAAEYKAPEGVTVNVPQLFGGMPGYIKMVYDDLRN